MLGYVGVITLGQLECKYVNTALDFFGCLVPGLHFHWKVFTCSPCLLLCFLLCFSPMVCFTTGFQMGCVPPVEDYSRSNRASASAAAFLLWCGFSLFLATALEGWNSGLQRAWQKFTGLQMLQTGPFSIPHHPEAREITRALGFFFF